MGQGFDEMKADSEKVREHYLGYDRWLAQQPGDVMRLRREEAEVIFRRVGITFAVYGAKDDGGDRNAGSERLIPFDLIPRVIPADEWSEMERGLRSRDSRRSSKAFSGDRYLTNRSASSKTDSTEPWVTAPSIVFKIWLIKFQGEQLCSTF